MSEPRWCIYYTDGSTFSDRDGAPEDAPSRDVQVIVQDDAEVGAVTVTGGDYYVYRGDRWYSVDIFGLFDFLLDGTRVKFGRYVTRQEYQGVMRKALEHLDGIKKSGWTPRERKP